MKNGINRCGVFQQVRSAERTSVALSDVTRGSMWIQPWQRARGCEVNRRAMGRDWACPLPEQQRAARGNRTGLARRLFYF